MSSLDLSLSLSLSLSLVPTKIPVTIKAESASKREEYTKHIREHLRSFGLHYVGQLEPAAIVRRDEALKKDEWLYPNSYLDYSTLIQSEKIGISPEQLQDRIDVYFPPLKISALDFCLFISAHFGITPLIGGSTVGHCFFGLKNHDLDFKIFPHLKDERFGEDSHNIGYMLQEMYCDYILYLLKSQGIPLNFKGLRIRELVKSVYLYSNLQIFNESRTRCEAVFSNLGHDLMCIINPQFRWYLTNYDRFLISLEDNAIYFHSSQISSQDKDIEKDLKENASNAREQLRNRQYIVENPLLSHNLFVRLVHASLKEFTIEKASSIVPISVDLLEKEYKTNPDIFIKRIHTLLEKFTNTHDAVDLLLISLSFIQKIKEPKLREQWCVIAAQSISTPKSFTSVFKARKQRDYSELLLLQSHKKTPAKSKPSSYTPTKNDLELAGFISRHPEITSDFLNVLHGLLLLEEDGNPRAKHLKKVILNCQSIDETIFRCASSWHAIKKFSKEMASICIAIGLPSKDFETEENLIIKRLLQYIEKKSPKIDFSNPLFEFFKKMASELPDSKILKYLEAKSELHHCLSKMSSDERKIKWGWSEFITVLNYRMRTTRFCPEERSIQQLNERLERLLTNAPNTDLRNAVGKALQLMVEKALTKQPNNIKLLYEIKRLINVAKQLDIFTAEYFESIDNQIIKMSFDIKFDDHADLLLPFYRLWPQDSMLSKNPQFGSFLLGNILKYASLLAKTDLPSNIEFLYTCLDYALKTPFSSQHFESINFIYQKLLGSAIQAGDTESITKIGLVMIMILDKIKGISLPENEIPQVLKLIEALLQLSKKTSKIEVQHYIGIKLVHYLAENCKIDATRQHSLLLKSASIVLLDKNHVKTQQIYKKTIELIFNQKMTAEAPERALGLCQHLTVNLDQRSSLMRRFVGFVAQQNIVHAEELLDIFKSKMDTVNFDQAMYAIVEQQISTKRTDFLEKGFKNWRSHNPNPQSFMLHLTIGRKLFEAIHNHSQKVDYVWLQNCLQEFINCLNKFHEEIDSSTPAEKEQLTLHIVEINKIINSIQVSKFELLLKRLWDISEEMNLIDHSKTSLPPILIDQALGEGRLPQEAFASVEKAYDGRLMDLQQAKWAIQLFNNVVKDPQYRESHTHKIVPVGMRLLQADSKFITTAQKNEFIHLLFSKRQFRHLIDLLAECPRAIGELCQTNPRNWEYFVLALQQYPDVLMLDTRILPTLKFEVISQPKVLSIISQQGTINLVNCLTRLCISYPQHLKNYSSMLLSIYSNSNLKNSKEFRKEVESFIRVLLTENTLNSLIEVCNIYLCHSKILTDKHSTSKNEDFSLLIIIDILDALFPFMEKSGDHSVLMNRAIFEIIDNLKSVHKIDNIDNLTELQELITTLKESKKLKKHSKNDVIVFLKNSKYNDLYNPKKTWASHDKNFHFQKRFTSLVCPLADGILKGSVVFTSRMATDLYYDRLTKTVPFKSYLEQCGLMTAALGGLIIFRTVSKIKDHPSITNEKLAKIALNTFRKMVFSIGSCVFIELLARTLMNFSPDTCIDAIDSIAICFPIVMFNNNEYHDEDLISLVVSLMTAYGTRNSVLFAKIGDVV